MTLINIVRIFADEIIKLKVGDMKQILLFLATMLFCCCSSDSEVMAEVPENADKTLVVYYSYTGNCRDIVNILTNQINADVLEIQPAEKGLRYEANGYALGTQLLNAIKANPNNASSYPAIDPVTTSLTDYQNIIIVTTDGGKARRTNCFECQQWYLTSGG